MSSTSRLAEEVAQRIETEIIARGWPVGDVLGSEETLMEEYGVSRPVWREAVRLLEHDNIARVRMGRGGGLVVTAPNADAVTRTAALYFQYESVGPDELYESWLNLETINVQRAIENLTDHGVSQLRRALEVHEGSSPEDVLRGGRRNFHAVIADLGGSRPMRLFIEVIIELATTPPRQMPASAQKRLVAHASGQHRGIANAIIARDVELAQRLVAEHLNHARSFLASYQQVTGRNAKARSSLLRKGA